MSIYKGGYLTIDCGGKDILVEGGVVIPGSFNAVNETFGKVVILENVTIGDETFKYFVLNNLGKDVTGYVWTSSEIAIFFYAETDAVEATAL